MIVMGDSSLKSITVASFRAKLIAVCWVVVRSGLVRLVDADLVLVAAIITS